VPRDSERPAAIVLGRELTGLATARGIADGDVEVHAFTFNGREPIHFSRCCRTTSLPGDIADAPLLEAIIERAKALGNRPVLIPTSDAHALLIARNRDDLEPYCRTWSNRFEGVLGVVSKAQLYRTAAAAGVEVIPSLYEPSIAEVRAWTRIHPPPYLLKPFYEGIPSSSLVAKNLRLESAEALAEFVEKSGSRSLIVQRLIQGGDGFIFDCYGLSDAEGRALSLASHRRWRQQPPNFGTTSLGEIPAKTENGEEDMLFDHTARLLAAARYHGIFGVEWLQDRDTGKLYLIDFNARPFTSIGHLRQCGLNLPLLGYRELIGENLSAIDSRPVLRHTYWVDFLKDLQAFRARRKQGGLPDLGWGAWLRSVAACRSFAYWESDDPGPGVYRVLQIGNAVARLLWKQMF
jgi:D-aspartate ligase